MFVAGIVVGGAIIIGHDRYSDDYYSDHSRHSNHSQYGDSQLRNEISNLENRVRSKETEVQNLRQRMSNNFNSQISRLKQEKNYSALNRHASQILSNVKDEMKRELETEIQSSQSELEEINKMISKINELELKAMGVLGENGFDKDGYDVNGFNKEGFDKDGFNHKGFNKEGRHKNGTLFDDDGYNQNGYDMYGFNKDGYDRDGYDKVGRDRYGRYRI